MTLPGGLSLALQPHWTTAIAFGFQVGPREIRRAKTLKTSSYMFIFFVSTHERHPTPPAPIPARGKAQNQNLYSVVLSRSYRTLWQMLYPFEGPVLAPGLLVLLEIMMACRRSGCVFRQHLSHPSS